MSVSITYLEQGVTIVTTEIVKLIRAVQELEEFLKKIDDTSDNYFEKTHMQVGKSDVRPVVTEELYKKLDAVKDAVKAMEKICPPYKEYLIAKQICYDLDVALPAIIAKVETVDRANFNMCKLQFNGVDYTADNVLKEFKKENKNISDNLMSAISSVPKSMEKIQPSGQKKELPNDEFKKAIKKQKKGLDSDLWKALNPQEGPRAGPSTRPGNIK